MLFKWITHKFCSNRLESRRRALLSKIKDLEAEQKDLAERIREKSRQLQRDSEDLEAQRQAELQETVEFLNHYLFSCQDMVQALQKYTEQAYAAVEVWLQYQVHVSVYHSAKQHIALLDEQGDFLREAEKAYSVLYDEPQRREWCTAQPESAFTANCHVQACANALKRRRNAIRASNDTIHATLERIKSQLRWVRTEREKVLSDLKAARSEEEVYRSMYLDQRYVMNIAYHHADELWESQINAFTSLLHQRIRGLHEQCEQLWGDIQLWKKRERSWLDLREQLRDHKLLKKSIRKQLWSHKSLKKRKRLELDLQYCKMLEEVDQKRQYALMSLADCRRQIEMCKKVKEDKLQDWYRLSPYEHRVSIETHLDEFLQVPKRRSQAIGGSSPRPSNTQRPNGKAHG